MNKAFSSLNLDLRERSSKPREEGITMMIDWGEGLRRQEDLLHIGGEYVDIAKIAVGISGLLPLDLLREKIEIYDDHGVMAFPGGQFLELALKKGQEKTYFEECGRAGYRLLELSDNIISLSEQKRSEIIRRATEEYGFKVLGEVGSKLQESEVEELVESIGVSLESGAWKSLVEAAEFFFEGSFNWELLEEITSSVPKEKLIFELPGKWIEGIHAHQVNTMTKLLIEKLGPEANIANVSTDDLMRVEALRTGLGTNMPL